MRLSIGCLSAFLFVSMMGCATNMPAPDAGTPDASPSCSGISGSYTVSGPRSGGSCPGSDGDSMTVDIAADPSSMDSYSLTFTSGGGESYTCVGRLVGCQLSTTCNAMSGGNTATLDATWNFTNAGFSGTHAYRATLPDSTMCTANYNITATRR